MAKMKDLQIIPNLNEPHKMVLLNCKYDLMKMCRTCNSECSESSASLFKYLKSDTEQIQIAEMLRISTTLKVELGDGFPMIICFDCINELIRVYHFIKKCKDTHDSMHQYVFNDKNAKIAKKKPVLVTQNSTPSDNNSESNPELFQIQSTFSLSDNFNDDNSKISNTNPEKSNTEIYNIPATTSLLNNAELESSVSFNSVEPVQESESDTELGYEVEEFDIRDNIDMMIVQKEKEDMLKKWQDKVTRQNFIPCPHCMKCFLKEATLIEHVAFAHTREKLFKCQYCTKAYMRKEKLMQHVRNKHVEIPLIHKCRKIDCLETFSTYQELREHRRNHDNKIWHCKECGQSFTYRKAFERHQVKHNGVATSATNETKYPCDICGKFISSLFSLQEHIKRHQKDYTYICEQCGKGFVDRKGLDNHSRKHLWDAGHSRKRYTCEVCGKDLASIKSLRYHRISIHENKPPSVPCPTCSKLFSTPASMKYHMKIHNREYNFTCIICGHKLSSQKELDIHTHLHTGETPYQCPKCPKAYRRQSMFQVHMKRHSKSLIQCDVCLSFLRPQFYEKHRAGHDNKKARDELKNENENSNTDAQDGLQDSKNEKETSNTNII